MTTKLFDTFNGPAGTDLEDHTPDTDVVGTGWDDFIVNTCELDGSGAVKFAGAGNNSHIDVGTADQWCISNMNAGGAANRFVYELRRDNNPDGTENCYTFNARPDASTDQLIIYRSVSGTPTQIAASGSSTSFDTSTTYSYEPFVNGTTINFAVDGDDTLCYVTDSTIATGDYFGLRHAARADGNLRVYDVQVDDTAPAAGVNPLPLLQSCSNGGF